MKAILGRKIGMSRMFREDGEAMPVTLIHAEPNVVALQRTEEKDGYAAVQLALPRKNSKDTSQTSKLTPGVLKQTYAARREFPVSVADDQTTVSVDTFTVGDVVTVIGTSKGKGFQGVVKRHGFAGGPASHGHRHVLRAPGSIGSRFPQHVRKGKRMAGRMGGERVTVKNLPVLWVDAEKHLLAVKGAVPGPAGSIVAVMSAGQ